MISLLFVCAFVLGSFPFGAWVGRARGVDILAKGSKNIGATNVYRVLGPIPGLIVSILDILKGLLPSLAVWFILPDDPHTQVYAISAGFVAVLGHCFSPFLHFKGGKGIATGFGALLGSSPLVAISSLVVFILVIAISRYVSLGSIVGVTSTVLFGWLFHESAIMIGVYTALTVFIVYKHRGNIGRLLAGTERRFKLKPDVEQEANPVVEDSSKEETDRQE